MVIRSRLFLIILLLIVSLGGLPYEVHAQVNQNIPDVSQLNVDELTDEQIQRFIDQVEAGGYTEDQLLVLARARGMSESQIQKLRNRINQVRQGKQSENVSRTGINRLRDSQDFAEEGEEPSFLDPFSFILLGDSLLDESKLEIFGMSFFESGTSLFEPSLNVPTPKNYILGPGDGILIDIWGAFEYSYDLVVSPDGLIRIEDLGPILVAGLSIEEASSKIRRRLKSIYSTLNENAFAEISLGQLRTINVNVVGEVLKPGTYTTSSFATAFNVLYLAGGPSESGTLRNIKVFRGGKQIATLDAYDYLIKGSGSNVTLQDQDVLLISPYLNRVEVYGEVKRPAVYELNMDESMADLILFAGGFNGKSYRDRISLRRNVGDFRAISTIEKGEFDDFKMFDGDVVEVKQISNLYKNRVAIQGAVFQPGEYELKDNLTLQKLISQAGGLRGDAFLGRVVIIGQNSDLSMSTRSVNLEELKLDSGESILLRNEDLVKVESIYNLREELFVQIQGEVNKPGKYPYAVGQTVEDLVFLAGGFKESAAKSFVEIARRNEVTGGLNNLEKTADIFNFPISSTLRLDEKTSMFRLDPYDLVVIRRSPQFEEQITVELVGEVLYPGMYALSRKDENISDVIKRAGGLTQYAYPKGATLVRRTEYYQTPEEKEEKANRKSRNEERERVMDQEAVSTEQAAEVRRSELQSIFERDTLFQRPEDIFKEQETIGIYLDEILKRPGSEFDLVLKEGDIINIPRKLETVRVRGEVLFPSNVRFGSNFSFKDFVSQAGGLTSEAKVSRSYVIYPNGTAQRTKSFLWFKNFPRVSPGAEIIVPEKPKRRKLSPGEIVSISSGLSALVLVINSLATQ